MANLASRRAQCLPYAIVGRDHTLADHELGAHEDERARAAHHLAARFDEVADLDGVNEMHIEMHGGLRLLPVRIPAGHSHRAVREGHQHAALHDTAAVVMLVLGEKRIAVRLAVLPGPERTDEPDETIIAIGFPTRGGGVERCRVRCVIHALSGLVFLEWEPGAENRLSIVDRADPQLAAISKAVVRACAVPLFARS